MSGCKSTSSNHIPKGMNSEKPYDLRVQTYQQKKCCVDLKSIVPLQTKKTITATMEESEKLIQIGNVNSPYLLIEIENNPDVHFYSIKSYYLEHKFTFVPMVSVLDSNFNVISQTSSDYISYQHQTLVYDDSHFWMYFSVDTKRKTNAKYLLVHTAREFGSKFQVDIGSKTNMQTTMIGNQPVSYAETSNAFTVKTLVSPSGVLQIDKLDAWSKPINDYLIQPL
tara:strand:+ start:582 stop:1253 length:672 start_codon:yes stop_codon:yes gene_type:complete